MVAAVPLVIFRIPAAVGILVSRQPAEPHVDGVLGAAVASVALQRHQLGIPAPRAQRSSANFRAARQAGRGCAQSKRRSLSELSQAPRVRPALFSFRLRLGRSLLFHPGDFLYWRFLLRPGLDRLFGRLLRLFLFLFYGPWFVCFAGLLFRRQLFRGETYRDDELPWLRRRRFLK